MIIFIFKIHYLLDRLIISLIINIELPFANWINPICDAHIEIVTFVHKFVDVMLLSNDHINVVILQIFSVLFNVGQSPGKNLLQEASRENLFRLSSAWHVIIISLLKLVQKTLFGFQGRVRTSFAFFDVLAFHINGMAIYELSLTIPVNVHLVTQGLLETHRLARSADVSVL